MEVLRGAMMRAADVWMVVVVVALAAGCLEKPSPWVPDGRLPDGVPDGEVLVGDGTVSCDLPDTVTDIWHSEGDVDEGDLLENDGGRHDLAGLDMDIAEIEPGWPVARGAAICPGHGGSWTGRPYRASVTWHGNVLVTAGE